MVAIQRQSLQSRFTPNKTIGLLAIVGVGLVLMAINKLDNMSSQFKLQITDSVQGLDRKCPYMSLSDLTESELSPREGERHMVNPPSDGKITLVCCQTTVGPWNIAVHNNWAPLGAERFLTMVNSGYFSARVPLMRCIHDFICQFGLSGDPQVTKQYRESFHDDPPWLPLGPTHRQNENGIKRFAKGYLAYAGAGPNSRGNQFIVSLVNDGPLAGGNPWEVPWGELVGQHSFEALDRVYYGYGEDGPSQGFITNQGINTGEVQDKFPKMDYINSCEVLDEKDFQ
jgi:peptidyl-prolyl cis-trans isomerase A (cyclophilin A)